VPNGGYRAWGGGIRLPIRVAPDRVIAYGVTLFLLFLWQLVNNTIHDPSFADWSDFWSGGATVGTQALINPQLHFAFEQSHGFGTNIWPYVPAFAWLFVPASHGPLLETWILNALLMFGLAAIAGALLADAFYMPRWFGVLLALAWPPVKIAALGGQNTPIALVILAVGIWVARRGSTLVLGAAIGALLYKPSIAAPFVLLLIVRREWRALAIVSACGACWYLLSVPAAAGDWGWPKLYVDSLRAYYAADFWSNSANAVSLPGLLMRFGVPTAIAVGWGAVLFVACLPRLIGLGIAEALSVTSVLAVAVSPHAWNYEPVIMLPAIFYALSVTSKPWLAWLIIGTYAVADASIVHLAWLPLNLLAVAVLLWAALAVGIDSIERTRTGVAFPP